ncbi:MAG: zinc metalloprotease HtpX, partial [Candidatus Dormibacter sp.]
MVKRIGTDWGLNVRMVLTMFLLACVYLAFIIGLSFAHIQIGFIIVIAGVLLLAQYYFSDKLILLSLGAQEVTEQQAPQLHDMVGRLAAMTGIPKPKVAIIDSPVPNAMATGRSPSHSLVA